MTHPVVFESVIDWLRLVNVILALTCAIGILTVPESPWRNSPASGARLLSLSICGMYLWSAYNSYIAIAVRADPNVVIYDYPVREYGLLFWLVLTLAALAQRHLVGKIAHPDHVPAAERGEPGPPGIPGMPGERGETGETGDAGDIGDAGERGKPGKIGETGDAGDAGDTGERGERGERGAPGPPGQRGRSGERNAGQ